MADLFDEMLNSIDSLSDDQLDMLLSILEVKKSGQEKAKEAGLLVDDGQIIACPHCGSATIKKHGKSQGKQRYMCKDCGKTFLNSIGTMFHHSKLNSYQWKELLKGMVLNLSLSKIAENMGICPSAVWYNRQKVLDMLASKFIDQDKFVDIVECDEYAVHLSFKGKRDANFFVNILGRLPRHHRNYAEKVEYLKKNGLWEDLQKDPERLEGLLTGDTYVRGTNKDSVCILTGKDRSGNLYLEPTCVGSIETRHIQQKLKNRLAPDAILVTDCNNSYNWFAEYENIHHEQILASRHAKGPYSLARVNAIHSKLAAYWPDTTGRLPATKYLDLSLMLFWWLEKNSDLTAPEQVEKLFSYLSDPIEYYTSYESLQNRTLPLDTKGLIPERV